MAILSSSAPGLQKLLNICANYAIKHDIMCNVKKTQCMVVPSTKFKLENTPSVFLNGAKLQYVDSYKYLGMFIHVRNDDLDIVRQFKCVILRTDILMRTFSSCSVEVKLFLFISYCSNCYCSHLWYNVTKAQVNKLRITCNNAMRRLFNLHFRCSASEMFANCNIRSMDETRRTCIFNYWNVLAMQSSHVLCHPLSYRNVSYGIIGLNVYIDIFLGFFATSICVLNVVIMRTCTRAPNI